MNDFEKNILRQLNDFRSSESEETGNDDDLFVRARKRLLKTNLSNGIISKEKIIKIREFKDLCEKIYLDPTITFSDEFEEKLYIYRMEEQYDYYYEGTNFKNFIPKPRSLIEKFGVLHMLWLISSLKSISRNERKMYIKEEDSKKNIFEIRKTLINNRMEHCFHGKMISDIDKLSLRYRYEELCLFKGTVDDFGKEVGDTSEGWVIECADKDFEEDIADDTTALKKTVRDSIRKHHELSVLEKENDGTIVSEEILIKEAKEDGNESTLKEIKVKQKTLRMNKYSKKQRIQMLLNIMGVENMEEDEKLLLEEIKDDLRISGDLDEGEECEECVEGEKVNIPIISTENVVHNTSFMSVDNSRESTEKFMNVAYTVGDTLRSSSFVEFKRMENVPKQSGKHLNKALEDFDLIDNKEFLNSMEKWIIAHSIDFCMRREFYLITGSRSIHTTPTAILQLFTLIEDRDDNYKTNPSILKQFPNYIIDAFQFGKENPWYYWCTNYLLYFYVSGLCKLDSKTISSDRSVFCWDVEEKATFDNKIPCMTTHCLTLIGSTWGIISNGDYSNVTLLTMNAFEAWDVWRGLMNKDGAVCVDYKTGTRMKYLKEYIK